jgi:polyribonucleotide nucleotidyltransferase
VKTGHKAMLEILEVMNKVRRYPAKTLPDGVTKIDAAIVDKNKARQIFGKKGSDIVRDIEKETETRIDTQDLSRILITSDSFKNIFAAKKRVYQTLGEFEKGMIYDVKVVQIEDHKFKVQVKDVYQGILIFEPKLKKIKKGELLKAAFVKFDHHGDPEFQCKE